MGELEREREVQAKDRERQHLTDFDQFKAIIELASRTIADSAKNVQN